MDLGASRIRDRVPILLTDSARTQARKMRGDFGSGCTITPGWHRGDTCSSGTLAQRQQDTDIPASAFLHESDSLLVTTRKRRTSLPIDPIPVLLEWDDPALTYFVQKDLLEQRARPIRMLWDLKPAADLVRKQLPDGSWKYPGKTVDPRTKEDYFLLETFRNLRVLVEQYGFTRAHPTLQKTTRYMFLRQTAEGDIRGILGNQYMPYYHAAILELLIKAGYAGDRRVKKGLDWLLAMRQDDGGWIIPVQAIPPAKRKPWGSFWPGPTIQPDRAKPHAHLATGMVLRAFAAHPAYRRRPEVLLAARQLKERFFKADAYGDRKGPEYWLKFQFPFWWSNLLTALDSLARLGFTRQDPEVALALDWFVSNQDKDGLWPTGYSSGFMARANRRWVGLAICRVLKAFRMT